jgi:hypothetical protein
LLNRCLLYFTYPFLKRRINNNKPPSAWAGRRPSYRPLSAAACLLGGPRNRIFRVRLGRGAARRCARPQPNTVPLDGRQLPGSGWAPMIIVCCHRNGDHGRPMARHGPTQLRLAHTRSVSRQGPTAKHRDGGCPGRPARRPAGDSEAPSESR